MIVAEDLHRPFRVRAPPVYDRCDAPREVRPRVQRIVLSKRLPCPIRFVCRAWCAGRGCRGEAQSRHCGGLGAGLTLRLSLNPRLVPACRRANHPRLPPAGTAARTHPARPASPPGTAFVSDLSLPGDREPNVAKYE